MASAVTVAEFSDSMSLGEARTLLRELVGAGHVCPLCSQLAKVYTFPLNAAMALGLIAMWRAGGREERAWVKVPDLRLPGGHMLKARFWRLIEKPPELVRADGSSRVGIWRVTPAGQAFVTRASTISSHARIFNNRCLSLVGEQVGIGHVLTVRHNYDELMHGEVATCRT